MGLHLAAMSRKVLLVEIDASSQDQCAARPARLRVRDEAVESASAALTLLRTKKFDALLVDFRLASLDGSDLLTAARHAQPEINIILMVEGRGDVPPQQPLRLRGYPLLTKPLKIEELARALETPWRASQPHRRNLTRPRRRSASVRVRGPGRGFGEDEENLPADFQSGVAAAPGSDHGRKRHGQGTGGAGHPHPGPLARSALCPG